jgi:hypothetical protein
MDKKSIILYILITLCNTNIFGQVLNIDRENEIDSLHKKRETYINLSFNTDKLKKELIDLSVKAESDFFFKKNYVLIALYSNDITLNGSDFIQNQGYFHLRYRDHEKRNYSSESFIQYQWNGALGMKYRQLIGNNLRCKILEKTNFDFYSGIGLFYENEQWNLNGTNNSTDPNKTKLFEREIFRINTYFKTAYKINDNLDISAITYFQLPFNSSVLNVRWFFDLNTTLKIGKNSNCIIHWDNTYDNYRLVPISNFYYSLSIGLQFKF